MCVSEFILKERKANVIYHILILYIQKYISKEFLKISVKFIIYKTYTQIMYYFDIHYMIKYILHCVSL